MLNNPNPTLSFQLLPGKDVYFNVELHEYFDFVLHCLPTFSL